MCTSSTVIKNMVNLNCIILMILRGGYNSAPPQNQWKNQAKMKDMVDP